MTEILASWIRVNCSADTPYRKSVHGKAIASMISEASGIEVTREDADEAMMDFGFSADSNGYYWLDDSCMAWIRSRRRRYKEEGESDA